MQTVWELLRELHDICHFQTREGKKCGPASASELKRWCQNGAVVIDGKKVKWDDVLTFPLKSVVLFPKHPITLWWEGE